MTDTPRASTWRDWIPALTLLLVITELDASLEVGDDEVGKLGRQLAGVDAKLDLLIRRTPDRP